MWKQKLLNSKTPLTNQPNLHIYDYSYNSVHNTSSLSSNNMINKIQELQSTSKQFEKIGHLGNNITVYRLEKNNHIFSCVFITKHNHINRFNHHAKSLDDEQNHLDQLWQITQKYEKKEIMYNDHEYDIRSLLETMKCFKHSSDSDDSFGALLFAYPSNNPQNVEFISSASGVFDCKKINTVQITFVGNLRRCMGLNQSMDLKSIVSCVGASLLITMCFRIFAEHDIRIAYLANEAKENGYMCYTSAAYACDWQPFAMHIDHSRQTNHSSQMKISDSNVSFYLCDDNWKWLIQSWNHKNEEAHFMYFIAPVLLSNELFLIILSCVIMDVQPWLNRHCVCIHQHINQTIINSVTSS